MPEFEAPGPEFRDFFEAEHHRLGSSLYLVVGSVSEAEELAQEAMVRVFERWERVRKMDAPVGYLYRTAFNLNRKRLRHLRVRTKRLLSMRSEAQSPTFAVDHRDEILRLLLVLPLGQRRTVVLKDWLELTDAEAGRILGISPGAVRVRLSRAHAALRIERESNDA